MGSASLVVSSARRSADVLAVLVNIYGSKASAPRPCLPRCPPIRQPSSPPASRRLQAIPYPHRPLFLVPPSWNHSGSELPCLLLSPAFRPRRSSSMSSARCSPTNCSLALAPTRRRRQATQPGPSSRPPLKAPTALAPGPNGKVPLRPPRLTHPRALVSRAPCATGAQLGNAQEAVRRLGAVGAHQRHRQHERTHLPGI
eukprot:scaffold531_cov92-Isochrysis_galbana.AAC.1